MSDSTISMDELSIEDELEQGEAVARLYIAQVGQIRELEVEIARLREALHKATEELEEIVSFTRTERCCLCEPEIASIEEVAQASRAALSDQSNCPAA